MQAYAVAERLDVGVGPTDVPTMVQGEGTKFHVTLAPFMVMLRLAMAWVFLWAGFDKLFGGFDSGGFLVNATSGPLKDTWVTIGQSATAVAIINPVVIWTQILMGFALFSGIATRLVLAGAAVQMFLFYLAQFPPEHNPFLDYFLVYILVFALLGALGAGRFAGIDHYVEKLAFVRRNRWVTYLLG